MDRWRDQEVQLLSSDLRLSNSPDYWIKARMDQARILGLCSVCNLDYRTWGTRLMSSGSGWKWKEYITSSSCCLCTWERLDRALHSARYVLSSHSFNAISWHVQRQNGSNRNPNITTTPLPNHSTNPLYPSPYSSHSWPSTLKLSHQSTPLLKSQTSSPEHH
jgi:hypothetical protein